MTSQLPRCGMRYNSVYFLLSFLHSKHYLCISTAPSDERHHGSRSLMDDGWASQSRVHTTRSSVRGTVRSYHLHAGISSAIKLPWPMVRHFILDCGCYYIRSEARAFVVYASSQKIRRQVIAKYHYSTHILIHFRWSAYPCVAYIVVVPSTFRSQRHLSQFSAYV